MTPNAPPETAIARFGADVLNCGVAIDTPIGICVSGGADSLALLLLARAALPYFEAATVDHGLRAISADEADFVADVCAKIGVVHRIIRLGPPEPGNRSDWARRARYGALRDWAKLRGLSLLMTAHHSDDQLETMLMRLNRGSGVAGLAGIRRRQADLCRPLLYWRKSELETLVNAAGLHAVDDPTNHDDGYDRARLRKQLASVDWLDPNAATRSAAALADADASLDWAARGLFDQYAKNEAAGVWLSLPAIPHELLRRVVRISLQAINSAAAPRGAALDALLISLQSGERTTLCGVLCAGGTFWTFKPEPPRRTN